MNISFSLPDFLIMALAVQGLILSALLFYSARKFKSNVYIGAFIFVVTESALVMEFDYSGILYSHPWLFVIMVPPLIILGPLIYLYTRSLIFADRDSKRSILLHLSPVVFFMKYQLIYLLYITHFLSIPAVSNWYVSPAGQGFFFGHGKFDVGIPFLSLVIYTGFSYRMIIKNSGSDQASANKQKDLNWLKMLLRLVGVLAAIWMISIVTGSYIPISKLEPWFHYFLYVPAVVFVYWLGMTVYIRQSKMVPEEVVAYNKPAVKKYYAETEADDYWRKLKAVMENEKVYLNPLLTVDELSGRLNLPEKAVSNLLNQHLHKNFNDFINEYRVEEAKRNLANPAFARFTIASIAFDCGFNSLATFQRCFKQFTGTTPSKYQSSLPEPLPASNNTQIRI